ncbi:MAG: transcriptional regulator GcvA [Burkholderiales bacterium]|nr:transcriptional regulator GcvA [Burkholderiales bacterium]
MSRKLPPLNSLRAFESAARHLSFARAAEELHVTPAAISQQIRQLEDHLGVLLFRRGKKLELEDAAEEVLPLLSEAFDQLERAMLKVRAGRSGDALVISAPPAFAARWLIPHLDLFHELHPAIELRLMATRRLVDFEMEDVDAAIRFGNGNYPGLAVERLMPESIVPVATPEIARKIATPADFLQCSLLEDEWHTENGVFPDWETWLGSLGVKGQEKLRIRHYGDANLAIQAAISGHGVALTWKSLVSADLESGRLVSILNHSIQTSLAYHFVMPKNRANQANVLAFREWLLEEAARTARAAE